MRRLLWKIQKCATLTFSWKLLVLCYDQLDKRDQVCLAYLRSILWNFIRKSFQILLITSCAPVKHPIRVLWCFNINCYGQLLKIKMTWSTDTILTWLLSLTRGEQEAWEWESPISFIPKYILISWKIFTLLHIVFDFQTRQIIYKSSLLF